MKIGIADRRIFGNEHFLKLKSFGFDFFDFSTSSTDAPLYSLSDEEFDNYLISLYYIGWVFAGGFEAA